MSMSSPHPDPNLWSLFSAVDTDRSGHLNAMELQRLLVNSDHSAFHLETVRLLIKLFDTRNDGTVTYQEFTNLWRYINDWQHTFQAYDRDRSGIIDRSEFKTALAAFGFNLSDRMVDLLVRKCSINDADVKDAVSTTATGGTKTDRIPRGANLDCFVRASVTVKTLTEAFVKLDDDRDGWAKINFEQFLQLVADNR
ncbi:hypothetical protein BC938DRAFT_480898 [Jimgerdemannia flammicorona]|uniref:EF-hand domain-containing protein n=1 Tax=Jimgerdemannia flammicorona TaxID=994334 RepID=A0A433QHD3_9FUNG|nr:hypothetical protein BC938DRAFT_480898 [Jimgerdemannia flammicorona]